LHLLSGKAFYAFGIIGYTTGIDNQAGTIAVLDPAILAVSG
jgi:hypothetical protein